MHVFTATILKYSSKGEKSGWTYVKIPDDIIKALKLPDKKGFRIKGTMDDVPFEKLSTYPVGEGRYIIAINGQMKKKLCKKEGAGLKIAFEKDNAGPLQSKELMAALKEEPAASKQFESLTFAHKNYFHRYVATAKGLDTRAGRIVHVINAMLRKQNFGEMIRSLKKTVQ